MDILLKGGVALLFVSLTIAWIATFTRIFPIKGLDGGVIKDYRSLVKAHLDYILMAMLLFVFYALRIDINPVACLLMVIGATTNPFFYVLLAVKPDILEYKASKAYAAVSFTIVTTGFVWAGINVACSLYRGY